MSDIGYKNSNQGNLFVSLNDIDAYIRDLKTATQLESSNFKQINNKTDYPRSQLNSNTIQIEDEYYAVARPKSSSNLEIRMLDKLNKGGIDYIELRSIDLNPFSNIGIDEEMTYFLEILMIYATFSDSQPMCDDEYKISNQNDLHVSIRGREPNLMLSRNGAKVSLQDWSLEVIESMEIILDSIDVKSNKYLNAIGKAKEKILNVEKTPSDIFFKTIEDQKIEMLDFGEMKGKEYKAQFQQKNIDINKDWDTLEKEVSDSLLKYKSSAKHEKLSFNEFLNKYLHP
jgi:glutamate--cysteine ligase